MGDFTKVLAFEGLHIVVQYMERGGAVQHAQPASTEMSCAVQFLVADSSTFSPSNRIMRRLSGSFPPTSAISSP